MFPTQYLITHSGHNNNRADRGEVGAGKLRLTVVDDNLWPNGRTSHLSDIFTRTCRKCLIFVMAYCSSRNIHVLSLSGSIFPCQPDGGGGALVVSGGPDFLDFLPTDHTLYISMKTNRFNARRNYLFHGSILVKSQLLVYMASSSGN